MNNVSFSKLFDFQKKSKIKAGDGLPLNEGSYPFYTSSSILKKSINKFLFDGNSLIFGTGGSASVHYCNEKFAVSTDCFVTQPKNNDELFLKYIYYFLSGNIHILENGFKGAGLKHISKGYISDIKIPLPPLDQQKNIATILDAADAYRQKTKALIEKYDELTQSLFLDMFGNIVRNELKWHKSKVGEVSSSRLGKMLDKKQQTGEMLQPYIKNTNVKWFYFDLEDLPEMDFNEKDLIEFALKFGDVMVCEGGEVGRAAIWRNHLLECYFQKALHRVRVKKEVLNEFYFVYWLKEMARLKGLKDYVSSVTIPHLTGAKLKSIDIALPPVNLQNQFADGVQAIEAQKAQAQASLAQAEDLFNSLLQRAFKGELS